MKKILLLLCVVLVYVQFLNAQENRASTKKVAHVSPQDQKFVDMEKALWDAWKTKDQKPYEELLSDNFFEVDVTGTYDKATEISYMDKCDLKDYAILDPQVRHLNDQTVLLTYKLAVHDICEGQPVPEHQTINTLFVREKGKWLKVLDSEVPKSDVTSSASEDERKLKQLEQDWLDSYREGDADKMSRILADDFIGRWGDGSTQTKGEQLRAIRTGEEKHSSNHLDECNVRIYGDTAVVTGLQSEQSILEGRDGTGTYSYTDVFVKRNGTWQVVASETKRVAGRSARERLIGSWKQVSDEEILADGSVVRLDEVGLLTFDASGYMSGQAMRRSEPRQKIPSDLTYQSNGYDAYFGTFAVDEEKHTVTHHVQGGVARQLVGKDLVRSYSFEGDRLIMTPANSDEHWTVVYEKNKTY